MRRLTEVTAKQAFSLVVIPAKPQRALFMKSQPRDDWNVRDFRLDMVGLGTS